MSPLCRRHIGLFGGTFDPVHNGHLAIARYVLDHQYADNILFIPAPNPPHKKFTGVGFHHRAAMLDLALRQFQQVSVSLIENEDSGPSFTINTVKKLLSRYPDSAYSLIIGADSLLDFPGWHRAEELISLVSLIVAGRGEVDENGIRDSLDALHLAYCRRDTASDTRWILANGRSVTYLPAIDWPVSSSDIRDRLREGMQPDMLPEAVYRYIREHNLYLDG